MKAIIIDDEQHCIESLSILLERFTEVEVVKTFDSPINAVKELKTFEADLLFLDIEMPYLNGFELLSFFESYPWKVVFTTAYSQYAIKAFKVNAIDYLLKPLLKDDLVACVEKISKAIAEEQTSIVPTQLTRSFAPQIKKIPIPNLDGLEMLVISQISHLESEGNYTNIHMVEGKAHLVSKSLKYFEERLTSFGFLRVHNSFMINPDYIHKYIKRGGGYLVMDGGAKVTVSRSKKEDLLQYINQIDMG